MAFGLFWVGGIALKPLPAIAAAGINKTVNYQGRLLTNTGAVVADGNYNMRFKVYQDGPGNVAADTGGTLMWTEKFENQTGGQGVVVKNGYFSLALGTYCAFSGGSCQGNTNTAVDWNQDTLWLSMDVGGTAVGAPTYNGELLPMRRMGSSIYALNSGLLGGLASSAFAQLGATQTFTGTNTFQPTSNIPSVVIKQTSVGSPTADIFNLQTANSTTILQATGPTANESAVTLQSVGATRALTLTSQAAATWSTVAGALTLTGAGGVTVSTASNTNIALSPNGSGDVVVSQGTGSSFQVTATAASTADQLAVSNSGQASTTSGVDGIAVTFGSSNASGDAIHVVPTYTGGATDALTFNAIETDPFTATNAAGSDTVNGISLGALTESGAGAIVSTALKVGSGWDNALTVNGVNVVNGSGLVQVAAGGTGQSSYAVGDLLYANTTTTLAKLADVATGSCLISGGIGVAPSWGACGVAGADIITVNGTTATDANFLNTTNTGTVAGVSFAINTVSNPDDITVTVTNATATLAGVVTNGTQTLGGDKTFVGTTTFQPTTNISSATIKQTSVASPTADIFNLQTANATTILQATGPTANESAVTLQSVGATRALTLTSQAAATWSTVSGALTLTGAGGVTVSTSANTNISLNPNGTGDVVVGGTTPTVTTSGATALAVDTGAAATLNLGNAFANAINIANNAAAHTISIGASGGANNQTIAIGSGVTGANTSAVTLGSNNAGASTTIIQGGNGTGASAAIRLSPADAGDINIGNTTQTGQITVGQSTAGQTISIGSANQTALVTQTVNIANGTQATANGTLAVNILSGAAGSNGIGTLKLGNSDRVTQIDLGNVAADAARTLNIGTGANIVGIDTINIGTGATTVASGKTINIGNGTPTGSGTNVLAIGSTANASTTTIQGGTGTGASAAIKLSTADAGDINIGTTTQTGTVVVGQSTATNTITVGNANTIAGATQTINIGAGTGVTSGKAVVTLGSTANASATTIQGGTGDVNVSAVGTAADIRLTTNSSTSAIIAKSSTNTAAAFQVQDAGSVAQLTVDTSAARVYVGPTAGDTVGTLLVLGNKTTSGDPTGINGGMYYNSNTGDFRCYVNGGWQSCQAQSASMGGFVTTGSSYTGTTYANIPAPSSLSYTKLGGSNTNLLINLSTSFFVTADATSAKVGINVDGTDYDCGFLYFNRNSIYSTVACSVVVPSLAAGAKTIQARWRVFNSGQLNQGAPSVAWNGISVTETN